MGPGAHARVLARTWERTVRHVAVSGQRMAWQCALRAAQVGFGRDSGRFVAGRRDFVGGQDRRAYEEAREVESETLFVGHRHAVFPLLDPFAGALGNQRTT